MTQETAEKIMRITHDSYEKIAQEFSATRSFLWTDFEWVRPYLKQEIRVLDIGCGNGRFFTAVEKFTLKYTGIDISESLIQEAKKKFQSEPRNPQFFTADICSPDFPSLVEKDYDTVCMSAVLNHLPTPELRTRALQNSWKVLAPKGILFITNWNLWQLTIKKKSIWKYALERFKMSSSEFEKKFLIQKKELSWRDLLTSWRGGDKQETLYYYSFLLSELKGLLKKSGFTICEARYSNKGNHAHWWNGHNSIIIARKK